MAHIVHITTVAQTATAFLRDQLRWLTSRGHTITLITSPHPTLEPFARREGIQFVPVTMSRHTTPWSDSVTLLTLKRKLASLAPDIVHTHTPKAGLLGMLAAAASTQASRIHQLHGLRSETLRGPAGQIVRWAERWTCHLAHRILAVSPSLRAEAVRQGVVPAERCRVLCHGSVNGLSLTDYPSLETQAELRHTTRARWGIPPSATCLGFVGRLVKDKGIEDLAAAWQRLRARHADLHMLLVGPFERGNRVAAQVQTALLDDPRVHYAGEDWSPIPYYAAMDIFTLPSHREGLGNVLLEAAAMRLPAVTCEVTGCIDAIQAGHTGLLVPRRDPQALADAIERYVESPAMRRSHGDAARQWVGNRFQREPIWSALADEYAHWLRRESSSHSRAA